MTGKTSEPSAEATRGNHSFSLISHEKLLQLYASMVKCRALAKQARQELPQSQLTADAAGREAVAAGTIMDLLPEDTVVTLQRGMMAGFIELIQSSPLESIFGRLPIHAVGPNPAERLSLAIVAAQENQAKKNDKIAVAFLSGEFDTSGYEQEAFKVANAQQLPILFVCERNLETVPETLDGQSCGFPVLRVDGSDAVAVYRVATEAISHARKGNGSTLIECVFDRSISDLADSGDPIKKMELYLAGKGLFSHPMNHDAAVNSIPALGAARDAARSQTSPGAAFPLQSAMTNQ